jgi:glycosyltransferase involved in cell wall biosynthesis
LRKIAWLSPFGPRSDVGAHSAAVVGALHRVARDYACEVALFVEANGPTYPSPVPRIAIDRRSTADTLSLFDVVALNIGNNCENNGLINELALSRGGVVFIHDLSLHGYVASQILGRSAAPNRYLDILCRYHGEDAIEALSGAPVPIDDSDHPFHSGKTPTPWAFPLLAPFLEKAEAVVVHSMFASEMVAAISDAPQLRLFLPSDKKPPPRAHTPSPDGRVRFCMLGHIHRSKQVRASIEAFAGSSQLRATASLRIAGGAIDGDYISELLDLARTNGLLDIVKFEFNVSERRLLEIKAASDVFVNIRFPNSEGGSGSLAEQMACGAPTIVLDSGCFREMPDQAVMKISDISTSKPLRKAMERLAADADLRDQIGRAAVEYGREATAEAYARQFLAFVTERRSAARGRAAETTPFPWLRRRPDGAAFAADPPSRLLRPDGPPLLRSSAGFDAATLAKYLALGLFRRPERGQRADAVARVLARLPAERRPRLVSRLAYLLRRAEARAPVPPWNAEGESDAEALAILWLFDPPTFAVVLYLLLLGRAPTPAEIEQAPRLGRTAWEQVRAVGRREAPPFLASSLAALPSRLQEALAPALANAS